MYLGPITVSGPTLTANGFTFGPPFLTFNEIRGSALTSDALDFSRALTWQTSFSMSFNRPRQYEILGGGNAVSVTVSEASSLMTSISGAALAIGVLLVAPHRRQSGLACRGQ
jgi:hypothetical protein